MNNKEREFIIDSSIQMYESLNKAINEAGGGDGISWRRLKQMTVQDLIIKLSPNNIRFYYDTGDEIDEEKEKNKKAPIKINKAFICPNGHTFVEDFDNYDDCNPALCVNYEYCDEEANEEGED